MHCIDRSLSARIRTCLRSALAGVGLMAGCSTTQVADTSSTTAARPGSASPGIAPTPASSNTSTKKSSNTLQLAAPGPVKNWNEVRRQAAQRMVAANPDGTYLGVVPDALLAIPVLEIELNGDGSVRKIEAMRLPRQAKDTTQLAMDAVRRAAPFGDVSRLPRPWRFIETFLFSDDRKFKPRTLD